jgi:hypothetical protein
MEDGKLFLATRREQMLLLHSTERTVLEELLQQRQCMRTVKAET